MIGRPSLTVTSSIAVAILLALLPSAAMADCGAWELPHEFNAVQANGYNVVFEVDVTNGVVAGSAHYYTGDDFHRVDGSVFGTFDGINFDVVVSWAGKASGGYKGGVGSNGKLFGVTKDEPGIGQASTQVIFRGKQIFRCASDTSAAPPPADNRPVKHLGKKKLPPNPLDQAGVVVTPGGGVGQILRETTQPPAGGGAEYATAITPATVYVEPGGAASKNANGDDIGMPAGSKALVLEKRTNPVWYKVQTNPVGWVWGEDVAVGP